MFDFLIVTPVLNGKSYIQDCMDSVECAFQDYEYKHLIVDGGSTDGTVELVESTSNQHIELLRAPGTSMYEALNMGIERYEATIFYQLNCDDLVLPLAAKTVVEYFRSDPELTVVTGATITLELPSQLCRTKISLWDQFSVRRVAGGLFVNQPSTFVRHRTLLEAGGFNCSYKYAADTELWLRLMSQGCKYRVLNEYLSLDRLHSGSARLTERHLTELQDVRARYQGGVDLRARIANSIDYSQCQLKGLLLRTGENRDAVTYVGSPFWRLSGFFFTNRFSGILLNLPFISGAYRFKGRVV